MRLVSSVALALIASLPATAQSPVVAPANGAPRQLFGFIGGLDGMMSQYRPARDDAAGLGSRGWGMGLNVAATIARIVVVGADLGGAWVGDDSSFTQGTTGGQKESSTMTYFASAFAGLKTPAFGGSRPDAMRASIGINLGVSKWGGGRSIDQCIDCRTDRLTIAGGSYVEPFIIIGKYNNKALAGLKVGFRSYTAPGATVQNVLFVGIGGIRERRT